MFNQNLVQTNQNLILNFPFDGSANSKGSSNFDFDVITTLGPAPSLQYAKDSPGGHFSIGTYDDTSYLSATAAFRAKFSNLSNYTLQFWVYIDSLTSQPVIVRYLDTIGSSYFEILATGEAFWITPNKTNLSTACSACVTAGRWHHLAWVWDGSKRRIYINNILRATSAAGDGNGTGVLSNFEVGRHVSFPMFFLNGKLKNLTISNIVLTNFPTI